ncbi:mitochondrial ribosomal protein l43 [Echinococcus multilocularis]|uniref:Large ribosomal subunit protein mL43 n=1 Tax=Echinococcus multilocularis TaxID=6211 RepID=A0A087W185_ECHMU|nr:mitochondrial ribosomal protein l43 [Echinococcus multilocularis]
MSGNVLPRATLKVPLSLGIGRYVCQLKRVTFKFCKSRGDSRGVRDFIESEIVNFARANPSVVFYIKPRRHRAPLLVAEYLNGNWQYLRMAKMSSQEICAWLQFMITRSGENIFPIYKPRSSHMPSIQGMWSPYDTPDLPDSLMTPSEIIENLQELSVCDFPWEQSAQDYLQQIHEQRQKQRKDSCL